LRETSKPTSVLSGRPLAMVVTHGVASTSTKLLPPSSV